ncbi:MAG TPA: preprotein translocase subunit SecA [Spirochaetia bacterium]|nr:preprotein translocase subunit SecA [Spirochaetales bacterium]HQK33439.1 preprotein translocase subunit SecA [Spirochaetales bacterium]HRS64304.1 preprotein translocase subunit SecA [Spirochaetia bacterium]HRV27562.1 preprotein translocase subunit SecA [Spirochaetia bacterium]
MAFNPLTLLFGSKRERDISLMLPILQKINACEAWACSLSSDDFPKETEKFRNRILQGETLDAILPEAFALAREAARRTLGERPFDTQILGGIVLHSGKIVEMKTGEGKTLSSVAAAYLNALTGKGVHIITVNDYLAERDSQWMGSVFKFLGLSVGVILSSMDNAARKKAYECDITYGTNNEFGFDYLRDNMVLDMSEKVQRGHHYCIIDEIDSVLIDEARTPLIISGAAEDDTYKIVEVQRLIHNLVEVKKNPETGEYPKEEEGEILDGDYKIDEKNKRISFTSQGLNKIEELLKKRGLIQSSLFDEQNFEYTHYFTQAIRARELFHKDVDYVVQDGLVQIVDEFTGRILHGRRYSDGLHEALEAKERIRIARRNRTMATISFQNYFRLYTKLSGMTGTAETEALEFQKIYNLDVIVIPTNKPVIRNDEDDIVFLNEADKFAAICDEVVEVHKRGQPILIGTVSIEKSEKLSAALTKKGIKHEVLNAKNHAREAGIIAEAGSFGAVTIATNMAGRGTDIKLGGNFEHRVLKKAGTNATPEILNEITKKEYPEWLKDNQKVKESGGLYVLGTERHESRRIDNQLRGRSGRQGDPGKSKFFISLDDELMRLFGGSSLKNLMQRIGMKPGDAINHPLLNKTIENAQKKVEERNFEVRKHLLEYDDVLNEQRKFIYTQRDEILQSKNLIERVERTAYEYIDDLLEELFGKSETVTPELLKQFSMQIKDELGIVLDSSKAVKTIHELRAEVENAIKKDIEQKVAVAGMENINQFIKLRYIMTIDKLWIDHLENMEALREAVYLRHYAQKNPLMEYKLEGFNMFDEMILAIKRNVAIVFFKARIQQSETRTYSTGVREIQTQHQELGQFNGGQSTSDSKQPVQQTMQQTTVVRTMPKVGRNDPCPCGSGKKYKHCHGR